MLQGMTNIVGFTLNIGDTTWANCSLYRAKTNRIGDTKYNIQCSNATKVLFEYPKYYLNEKGKACKVSVNGWRINLKQ